MCGFAGHLTKHSGDSSERTLELVARMAATLEHRGPDDFGAWADVTGGFAVGFRRLSIIDLSPAGHQPMVSGSGRYVIAYNGEVYNHTELRSTLEKDSGIRFRSISDTEVVLESIEAWGLERALNRFIGMFAFALWDRVERRLALVRDRLGVKPLYYGSFGSTLVFGSELKALRAHPAFRAELDRGSLVDFLRFGYVPGPATIYQGVYKLPAGAMLELGTDRAEQIQPRRYWSAEAAAAGGFESQIDGLEGALVGVESLLQESVRLRMVADVPVGVFLSGGIDSSLVAALMQQQSSRPINTFTIGFKEQKHDEAGSARSVAKHLGTNHRELTVTPGDAMEVIPTLPQVYDEPFGDASQIPTILVSRMARESVTVALSGDGGDELFGGYSRYHWAPRIWQRLRSMPQPARFAAAGILQALPASIWNTAMGRMRNLPLDSGDKAAKVAQSLKARRDVDFFHGIQSHWIRPESVVAGAGEAAGPDRFAKMQLPFLERMMLADQVQYLPDDVLVKVDRASMSVGLEVREPMLDHRLVELAWKLPTELKVANGKGKVILKSLLRRLIPSELVDRPKAGFTLPLDEWLRGPLKHWAEALIEPARLRKEGYFHPEVVESTWRDHQARRRNRQLALWDILMFQSWLEHFGAGGSIK